LNAARIKTKGALIIMSSPPNPNKALWEKGDFTRIAATMRQSGEELVKRIGIKKGLKVLDLGCGDGTTAVPSAQRGADVLGVDIARNLVAAGNKRAAEQGLTNLKFQEGDATNLQEIPDGEFDLAMSIFGAMFAPKLDSQRSDARGADLKDQFRLHTAAAGRLYQSHDLGDRESRR
jgi:SAM-dependent methyltransferase